MPKVEEAMQKRKTVFQEMNLVYSGRMSKPLEKKPNTLIFCLSS